ncbi:MAG: SHOCT domain-containing protein [Candidatus Woesearchaeota archaeon]
MAAPPDKDTPPGLQDKGSDSTDSGGTADSGGTEETTDTADTTLPDEGGINWEMVGVIVAIIGIFGGWLLSRRVRGKTARYMGEIDRAYKENKEDPQKGEKRLSELRERIEEDFKKGKLNDQTLALLESRLDKYSEKLRTSIIESDMQLPPDIQKKIKHMLSDGVITKEEYDHFLKMMNEEHGMSKGDEQKLKQLMKRWKGEDKR